MASFDLDICIVFHYHHTYYGAENDNTEVCLLKACWSQNQNAMGRTTVVMIGL